MAPQEGLQPDSLEFLVFIKALILDSSPLADFIDHAVQSLRVTKYSGNPQRVDLGLTLDDERDRIRHRVVNPRLLISVSHRLFISVSQMGSSY